MSSLEALAAPPATTLKRSARAAGFPGVLLAAVAIAAIWFLAACITGLLGDRVANARTDLLASIEAAIGVIIAACHGRGSWQGGMRSAGKWLVALPTLLTLWEIATAKTGLLPLPLFASPQAILEAVIDDRARLAESALYSLALLLPGYGIGAVAGFATGVGIGWYRGLNYWGHPILRFIGPLPATAWLPIAFFVFPTSRSASTFLIALSSAFPITILTASGVRGVSRVYYDVARNFDASTGFMLRRVAIPAALPNVFVGLFMGMGASFAVLIIAEMMGVKAGLGWYLQWAQGWAAYANLYAALVIMAALFSSLIALLFAVRDRVLSWQKGTVEW